MQLTQKHGVTYSHRNARRHQNALVDSHPVQVQATLQANVNQLPIVIMDDFSQINVDKLPRARRTSTPVHVTTIVANLAVSNTVRYQSMLPADMVEALRGGFTQEALSTQVLQDKLSDVFRTNKLSWMERREAELSDTQIRFPSRGGACKLGPVELLDVRDHPLKDASDMKQGLDFVVDTLQPTVWPNAVGRSSASSSASASASSSASASALSRASSSESASDEGDRIAFVLGDWPVFRGVHRLVSNEAHASQQPLYNNIVALPAQFHAGKSLREAVWSIYYEKVWRPFTRYLFPQRHAPIRARSSDDEIRHYMSVLFCAWLRRRPVHLNQLTGRVTVERQFLFHLLEEALPLALDFEDVCRNGNFSLYRNMLAHGVRVLCNVGKRHYPIAFTAMTCWITHWERKLCGVFGVVAGNLQHFNEVVVELVHSQMARALRGGQGQPSAADIRRSAVTVLSGVNEEMADSGLYKPRKERMSTDSFRDVSNEMDTAADRFVDSLFAHADANRGTTIEDGIHLVDRRWAYRSDFGVLQPSELPPELGRPCYRFLCQAPDESRSAAHTAVDPVRLPCGHVVCKGCRRREERVKGQRGRSKMLRTCGRPNCANGDYVLSKFCGNCESDLGTAQVAELRCGHLVHTQGCSTDSVSYASSECRRCADYLQDLGRDVVLATRRALVDDNSGGGGDDEGDQDDGDGDGDGGGGDEDLEEDQTATEQQHELDRVDVNELYKVLVGTAVVRTGASMKTRASVDVDEHANATMLRALHKGVLPPAERLPSAVKESKKGSGAKKGARMQNK